MWGEEEMELESQNLELGGWGVAIWDCNHWTKRVAIWNLFEIVTVEHKGLSSEIVTMKEIGLGISKIVIVKEIGLELFSFY